MSSRIPDENYEIPETAQLDELQTFVGSKKSGKTPRRRRAQGNACQDNKIWLWTAVNSHQAGVLKWTMGDRSQLTFGNLWSVVRGWECFLYITDGWKVYPIFISDCDHLVSKTAMTRVEGENTCG